MCVPIWMLSLIKQVMQKKFNRFDVRLHGPDAQTLLWKLQTVQTLGQHHPETLWYFDHNFPFKYRIRTKSASLES
jgi:hypothetical protein